MEKLDTIRIAGRINREAIQYGMSYAKAGMILKELDLAIGQYIIDQKAVPSFLGYNGFPGNCCLSVNDTAVHGIPNEYVLQKGDLLTIDCGTHFEGYHADSAISFLVDDDASDNLLKKFSLIEFTECVLDAQLKVVQNGCTLFDIANAGENEAIALRYASIIEELGGHKIGEAIHEEPFIPMSIDRSKSKLGQRLEEEKYKNYVLRTGDIICLEPVCTFGDGKIYKDDDGWSIKTSDKSLVAHKEHTVLVKEKGYEILT